MSSMRAGELQLVPLGEEYLEFLRVTRRAVGNYLFAPNRAITTVMQRAWYRDYLVATDRRVWVATHRGEPVGYAQLTGIDPHHRSAEAGFVIAPVHQGQGYGRALVRALLGLDHKLHRIEVRVFAWNERAITLYGTCGFEHEGLLRDAVWKNGQYHDVVVMAWLDKKGDTSRQV